MKKVKIVVIGAGSASFGLSVLGSLISEPGLRGSELFLVDINEAGLEQITRLAERMNREWGSGFSINSSTDRRKALDNADFVILSVAIDRDKCWEQDYEIARRFDIIHYAENGGPGAFAHTARNIAIIMPILRDIEELSPDAWLLNFTNPVPRICISAARYSKVKTVGLCHQLNFGYMMMGVILAQELGLDVPADYRFVWSGGYGEHNVRSIAAATAEKVDILAAGINHFTWMLDIRHKDTGEDLYPILRERMKTHNPRFEPLSLHIAKVFGLFPVPGDCHMCEYLPYTHNVTRNAWDRYDIQMYQINAESKRREKIWEKIGKMADGKATIDHLRNNANSERAEKVISAIASDAEIYEPAVNIPNRGYISNLPENAIVEVPAIVNGAGIEGRNIGSLPEPVAELCRRQITVAELAVEAGVKGDRDIALQALALDPMVDDLDVASGLLEAYLSANREYLTQFSSI